MRNVLTRAQYAEVVAAQCIVDAETKDHKNWEPSARPGSLPEARKDGARAR
jgi:hypothetical protein